MIEPDDKFKDEAMDSLHKAMMDWSDAVLGPERMPLPISSEVEILRERIKTLEAEVAHLIRDQDYLRGWRDAMRGA